MTPENVIKTIAAIANEVAWQAGVSGMELAGQFVSVLATHPEKINGFLDGTLSLVEDETLFHAELGCLTYMTLSGKIMSPKEVREQKDKLIERGDAE